MSKCTFVIAEAEGRKKAKTCPKKAFLNDLCTDHQPKAPKADASVYTVMLARAEGATAPNSTFAALAGSSKPTENYKQRIEHLRTSGPRTGGEESVHGVSCLHDTQPSNNVTVWFSWSDKTLTIWGLGSHSGGSGAGNDSYTMVWFDGKNKSWSR